MTRETLLHPAAQVREALLKDCTETYQRGSGPGGQHRNKVETEVVLTHHPSGIRARAGERRRRADNHRNAVFRLRLILAVRVRRPVTLGVETSELWQSRCRGGRIACNPSHWDFPAVLAEALDAVAAADWQPRPAAAHLDCSMSQLVKLVKAHPPGFVEWNRRRAAAGDHPLR